MIDYEDRLMDDGAVIESALPMGNKPPENTRYKDLKIYKAQIEEVIYKDNERNKTGHVEYDLVIMSGNVNEGYRKIRNAVSLNSLGGINDYEEIIYKAKTKEFSRGAGLGKAYSENTNGDIVALMFLEGNEEFPVIIGPWSHKRNNNSASESDGHRMKGEYNGVQWEINKDGEFIITLLGGPRDDSGNLTNESNGGLLIKLSKDGKINIDSGSQPIITIDKNSNEVTVEANSIKIGSNAVEPIVLGNTWVAYNNAEIITKLNALITAFNTFGSLYDSHTHNENGTGGGVTDPPNGGGSPGAPSSAASASSAQLALKGKAE